MSGDKSQAHIHPSFFQRGLNLGRGNFFHDQADVRILRVEKAEELRDERDIQDRDDAEAEQAAQSARAALQFLEEILQLAKDGARVFLKDESGRGE